MLILAGGVMPLALAVGAAPAQAALVVLDFEGTACATVDGAVASKTCDETDLIGSNYGSTANLAVSYDSSENTGSRTSLAYTTASYSHPNDTGKAGPFSSGPPDELSKIFFAPAAGFEVSFVSFEHVKLSATSSANFIFKVLDQFGTELFSGGINDTHVVNTAYFTGPLTFAFGNGGQGSVAVDNIIVDVRPSAVVAVPEPASWALMIAGLGLTGGTMRARRRKVAFAA
jgi:hypothetical protein